jgi:hypothetical protein
MRKDYRIKEYISPLKPFRNYRKTSKLKQYYEFFSNLSILDTNISNSVSSRPGEAKANEIVYVKETPFQNVGFSSYIQTDPSSYYRIPYNSDIENNGRKLTIATWISLPDYRKLTPSGPAQTMQVIFSKIISGGSTWSSQGEMNLIYSYTNNALEFSFNGEDPSTSTSYILTVESDPLGNLLKEIRANDWIHVAVVIEKDTYNRTSPGNDLAIYDLIKIYVNGELIAGRTISGHIGNYSGGDASGDTESISPAWRTINNSGDILIGRGLNDVSGLIHTRMKIFDFAYWNDNLSAESIMSLYSIAEYFEGSGFLNIGPRVSIKQKPNTLPIYYPSTSTPKLNKINKTNTTPLACNFPFDDNRSIDFQDNTLQDLQYPLGLLAQGIDNNLRVSASLSTPNSLPDIQAPGYTSFAILEKTYLPSQINEGIAGNTPFNEALVAPNSNDSFFGKTNVIQGFESSARNKIQVVLELPVNSTANISRHSSHWDSNATTNNLDGTPNNINPHYDAEGEFFGKDLSGFLYYNFKNGNWEQKGLNDAVTGEALTSEETAQQVTAQNLTFQEGLGDPASRVRYTTTGSIKFVSGTSNIMRMFYPGGAYYRQSTFPGQSALAMSWGISNLNETDKQLASNIGSPICSFYAPNANQYFATSSQTVKMSDYIQHPFLLEKVVLEIPDTLARKVYDYSDYDVSPTCYRQQDDYVFFLMRQNNNYPGFDPQDPENQSQEKISQQVSSSIRYIICSGAATFYNGTRVKPAVGYGHTGSWAPQNSPSFSHDFGETINSLTPMNQMSYTGSISLKMEPAVASQKNHGSIFVPTWNGSEGLYITQSFAGTDSFYSQSCVIQSFWPGGTTTLPLKGDFVTGSREFSFTADLNTATTASGQYNFAKGRSDSVYNERTFFEYNPYLENINTNFSARIIDSRTYRPIGGEASDKKLPGYDVDDQWRMSFADRTATLNAKSPYLLFPEDELILGVDAALGLTATMAAGITADAQSVNSRRIVGANNLTGSLLKINPGSVMYLRFYGSLIKDQIEAPKHPEPIGFQEDIQEVIIGSPVLDQYDVSIIPENSGSYRERFFTGSMTVGSGPDRKPNLGLQIKSAAKNPGAFIYDDSVGDSGEIDNDWYPNNISEGGATQSTVLTCSIPYSATRLRYPDGWNNEAPGPEISNVYIRFLSGTVYNDPVGTWRYMSNLLDQSPEGKIMPAPDEIWCRSSVNLNASFWNDPYKSENWLTVLGLFQAFNGVINYTTNQNGGTSDYFVNFGSSFLASSSKGGIPGLTARISQGTGFTSNALEITSDPGTGGNKVIFLQSSCSATPFAYDGFDPYGTIPSGLVPNNNYSRMGSTGSLFIAGTKGPTIGFINDVTASSGLFSSIDASNPTLVNTTSPHNLIHSQSVWINGLTDPDYTDLNGEEWYVKVDNASTFWLYSDITLSDSVNKSAAGGSSDDGYYNSNGLWWRPDVGGTQLGIIPNATSSLKGGLVQKNPIRALAATATKRNLGDFASFNRFITMPCSEEIYYDSAVPGIFDVWKVQGLTPFLVNIFDAPESALNSSSIQSTSASFDVMVCGISAGNSAFTTQSNAPSGYSGVGSLSKAFSSNWWGAYPFEPKYLEIPSSKANVKSEKIKRKLGTLAVLSPDVVPAAALYWINNENYPGWGQPWTGQLSSSLGVDFSSLSPGSNMGTPSSLYGSSQIGLAFTMENQIFGAVPEIGDIALTSLKVFYGIGDGFGNLINSENEDNIYPTSALYSGDGKNVDVNGLYPDQYKAFRRMKKPRGWKYGLINAIPQSTQVVYRSDHFGQFRDMLEGRKYSVFINSKEKPGQQYASPPIEVKFQVPVWDAERLNFNNPGIIDERDPVETASGNLSIFATSSLPFFDETGVQGKYPIGRSRPKDIFYTEYDFKFEEILYKD